MSVTVWFYAAMVCASVPVLWWGLGGERKVSEKAVRNLGTVGTGDLRRLKLEQQTSTERIALPVLKLIGRTGRRFTPVQWLERYEKMLAEAGRLGRWTPEQVVGAKLVTGALGVLWAISQFTGNPSSVQLLLGMFVAGLAFFVPDLLISSMASRRRDSIELDLPDVLDQLTMSVEAGLSFEAALGRISQKQDHALAEEFGRLIQDIRYGTPRAEALSALANRTGVEDLRHVVLSLRQAEKLGAPLAHTLRVMSEQMRQKRAFRAEEKAHKLPVKMIFPLGLCILPALFIVLLGPAFIQLAEVF